jgi:hypothetical protein
MRALASLVLIGLVFVTTAGFGSRDSKSEARRDANRFVLEKLNRQSGEGWSRSGRYFLWSYRFSRNGCDLEIRREAIEGGQVVKQEVPLADVIPLWMGNGSLGLYCQSRLNCIDMQVTNPGDVVSSSNLSETPVLAPEPDDLPKLKDAFDELHRLCDDAYGAR